MPDCSGQPGSPLSKRATLYMSTGKGIDQSGMQQLAESALTWRLKVRGFCPRACGLPTAQQRVSIRSLPSVSIAFLDNMHNS